MHLRNDIFLSAKDVERHGPKGFATAVKTQISDMFVFLPGYTSPVSVVV